MHMSYVIYLTIFSSSNLSFGLLLWICIASDNFLLVVYLIWILPGAVYSYDGILSNELIRVDTTLIFAHYIATSPKPHSNQYPNPNTITYALIKCCRNIVREPTLKTANEIETQLNKTNSE